MRNNKISKTGRIGRFAKIIEKKLGEDALQKIMVDSEKYDKYKPVEKSEWWKVAVERLEKEVGKKGVENIMHLCGQKCCGAGNRKTAKKLWSESKDMKDFLEKCSSYGVKEGEIEYKLKDKNKIIGRFNRCFCKQASRVKEPHKNTTYCECSAEFHRVFFEAGLEKPVKVEIEQSIISGAVYCKFIIHI